MAEPGPRYSFDPLERRGVLLGLQAAQLLTVAAAAALALVAATLLGGPGHPIAVIILLAGVGSAIWAREGRPASAWLVEVTAWVARHARGPSLDDRPLAGTASAPAAPVRARSTSPTGIELSEIAGGHERIGVVVDRRHRRWVAVVPVRGASFALLDPGDQAGRLDGFRVVLNSLGRPGTAVTRVQWIERSYPEHQRFPPTGPAPQSAGGAPVDSYGALLAGAKPPQRHESWLAVAVEGPPWPGSVTGRRAEEVLRRELRLLQGQLRNADLQPSAPLDRRGLASMIAAVYDQAPTVDQPAAAETAAAVAPPTSPWPLAEEERWSCLRSGGSWHATYWIADWPRIEVGPSFLMPLLLSEGRRTVSLVMEPVPPHRAARDARSARTADAADEQLRSRAGFLPNARRDREAEGVVRREAELAMGHAEFRFSGYVAVHAADRQSLGLVCAEAEQAAQASQLELRRLYGRQRDAFTWTLPLGRGLR